MDNIRLASCQSYFFSLLFFCILEDVWVAVCGMFLSMMNHVI
ncbi:MULTISPECIES: hypothetical protein [unclassified Moraxella]